MLAFFGPPQLLQSPGIHSHPPNSPPVTRRRHHTRSLTTNKMQRQSVRSGVLHLLNAVRAQSSSASASLTHWALPATATATAAASQHHAAAAAAAAFPALHQQPFSTTSTAHNSNSSNTPLRWVFLGPPGVGKGTYASRIAAALNVPHIAAGDLVRSEIKSGSALGQQMQAIVSQGQLLPDAMIIEVRLGALGGGDGAMVWCGSGGYGVCSRETSDGAAKVLTDGGR